MTATPKRPFPPLSPSSTSDAEAVRGNDWAAFRRLEQLVDHWTLKRWTPGQTGFYWYLTFDDSSLVELATHCQKELARPGIDPVPLDGLHLTLLGIGRSDTVSDEQLSTVTVAARSRLRSVPPFCLDIGPLTGSRSALRFSVTPWDDLLALHGVLREATTSVRSSAEIAETSQFRPHVGIGYLNTPQQADRLIEDVEPLRHLSPVTVSVAEVRLVQLRRDGRSYRWTDRAIVPLGS
ncbi:2'-5' RNA ligase family protein [Nocardia sp. NPDC057353]|uniref:2'-5' RNA ligase family protein n=1 Tax=Nocardia sp. NPDC057353 TaxID=3346104 RepID=UPI00363AFE64